ncbi:hypothetical protein [Achromobacter pulmonis]|uniref:hypothetical protein n=1 Tax=Achromobacter pulmonis TaxID=1389932 RepID=UPI002159DD16|nr:hypothetical protein [Achromobacter pulmonis]
MANKEFPGTHEGADSHGFLADHTIYRCGDLCIGKLQFRRVEFCLSAAQRSLCLVKISLQHPHSFLRGCQGGFVLVQVRLFYVQLWV